MKNEFKIRKLLGNKYHLSISYESDWENPKWVLFKKIDDLYAYYSEDNKAIMSSETNTEDELYKFAKEHHEIDEHHFMGILNVILAWFVMIIIIINVFIQDATIRGFTYGIDFTIMIYCLISYRIYKKNSKIKMLERIENWKKWYKGE